MLLSPVDISPASSRSPAKRSVCIHVPVIWPGERRGIWQRISIAKVQMMFMCFNFAAIVMSVMVVMFLFREIYKSLF